MYDGDRVAAIRERLEAATPGDWHVDAPPGFEQGHDDICVLSGDIYICQTSYDGLSNTKKHNVREDAEFIAHAKSDVQYLLEQLEIHVRE